MPIKRFDKLKLKAESLLNSENLNNNSKKELSELIHELSVNQIELELQNDELRKTQLQLEDTRESYKSLFDDAPLPYIVINQQGIIKDVNKLTSHIFQLDPVYLNNRPFDSFFQTGESEKIEEYLINVFKSEETIVNKFNSKIENKIFELQSNSYKSPENGELFCRSVLIDITDQELFKNDLANTKNQLNAIIRSLDDAVFIHEIDGTIIDILTNNEEHLFIPKSKAIGLNHYDIFDKNTADKISEKFNTLLKTGKSQIQEYRSPNDDNKYFQTKFSLVNMNNQDVIVSFARDISDRIQYRNELEKSTKNYQLLSNVTLEGIIITENDKIISYNKAAENLFGNRSFNNLNELLKTSIVSKYIKYVKMNRNSKRSEPYEIEMINQKGKTFWAELHGRTYIHEKKVVRVTAIRNIDKRKKDDLLIQKLSKAVEQNPVSIVITNRRAHIEYVNPAFCKITGYTKEELLNNNPRVLHSGNTSDEVYDELWNTITQKKVWKGEFSNKRKNGEVFIEYAIISPLLDKKNRITHYIGVKQDITKQKEDEAIIRQKNEELKELNNTKDKLFSIISHDLKNPFSALLNLSVILKEYRTSMTEKEYEKLIDSIQDATENTYNLLNNLLIWANSQMDGIEYNPKRNNIYDMTEQTIKDLSSQSMSKKIIILNNIQPKTFAVLDKEMIITVLRNLISNSIKYSHHNSEIFVDAKFDDKNIIISIADKGVGMTETQLNKLFKIEKNISTKGTNNEKGTGLGLILSKEFINHHNGEIWAESQKDIGSKFFIRLPQ